jgi:hypothetical protein
MGSPLRSRNALKDRNLGPDGAQQKVQAVRLSKAATIILYKNTVPLTSRWPFSVIKPKTGVQGGGQWNSAKTLLVLQVQHPPR